jgi:hypothetical protein
MQTNEEDERTRHAVNAAAHEILEEDEDEPSCNAMLRPAAIAPRNPSGPDLSIFITADPEKGRYAYRLEDMSTGLSHRCIRVLPETDETALALLAVTNSLKSILKRHANALLKERCGFASRADAVASGWRLRVELVVTDPDLASLGQVMVENEDTFDSLPLTENDRSLWAAVLPQTRRFDVSWRHIATGDPIITGLKQWAATVLSRPAHQVRFRISGIR